MADLNLKQNETTSEIVANEEVNDTTESKINAVAKVEKIIDCFSDIHTFWRSCNEKLYEGLSELFGVVQDSSDDDIEAICQKFNVKYEKQGTIPIKDRVNIIFEATFDNAFKDELNDERFKARFYDRRKIYKKAINNMLDMNLTKEQALELLKNKGIEAIARGKSKKAQTSSQAANQTSDECVSEMVNKDTITCELTKEQKAILDAISDDNVPNTVKSNFVIFRYNNGNVHSANRQGSIKKIWDYTANFNTYKGVEPFVVIVSCEEQVVGNPPVTRDDAVDVKELTNEEK